MNSLIIAGDVAKKPESSFVINGKNFYEFQVSIPRNSGVCDVVPCVAKEGLVNEILENDRVCLYGEVRTKSTLKPDGKSTLKVYALISSVTDFVCYRNTVELNATVCKPTLYRLAEKRRPNGEVYKVDLLDMLVASNRAKSKKSDYIPCIVWGRGAKKMRNAEVGTKFEATGRFQSRLYHKKYEDGVIEVKMAYEISIGEDIRR